MILSSQLPLSLQNPFQLFIRSFVSDSELPSLEPEDEPLLQANVVTKEMLLEVASAVITPRFMDSFSSLRYLIYRHWNTDWTYAFMLNILLFLWQNVYSSRLGPYGIWVFSWMVVSEEKIVFSCFQGRVTFLLSGIWV